MAESALQLRAYDPEAMASTTVPTTGDANSTVFSKIRSQALLQAAERRSQDKAKMTASNATPAAGSSVGNMNAPATRATGRKGKAFTKWKPRPMIKSAPEDYVIVIKPRERVSLHEAFTETGYGTAISAYLGPERARATSVLPSRDQNIIIVHTLDIEAADRLIGDVAVNTEKGAVPLHGYLRQDGGNTCHGVIVVRNTDTTETLQHRVCWRAGTIVEIRKFGTSNKARITFAGKEKPHYVSVQNYYKTIPACGQSAANACPNLQPNMCGLCGLHAPLVEGVRAPHNCVPRCSVCGGAHATNSRDCAAKFRTPKTAAKKSGKQKMTPKNKSRHLGQPSDQPPPHGGLEKRAAETHGKTGAWVNAVKNGRQDPRGPAYSYAGSENAELDQPFQLHDLKAALAKMKRGTAPGRDKITVKLLANLPDPTYDTLLAFINSIWLDTMFGFRPHRSAQDVLLQLDREILNPVEYPLND
ncbi:uncharacterized protein LOC125945818 [Dermacentor silvarum]|uniref:uncharacterized protein LOC125945818 n=1 Tax=Dermacentor silvarum TaxID=543639 RepID=UPI0021009030|nr:uncharacterized protein LOC125945818 [Dermacentor silvarum]